MIRSLSMLFLLGASAGLPWGALHAQPLETRLAEVRDRALADDLAWRLVESLTTEVGARPVGSPAMDRARDWGVARLEALGFENIRVETYSMPAWRRGERAEARVVAPYGHRLEILTVGNSGSTPDEGLAAPVALFRTFQEMLDQPKGSLAGKIAVVTQKMARTQDISGYIAASPQRGSGAAEAEARGAVGYLVRSLSTADDSLPHTGHAAPSGIPAAALSPAAADLLERIAACGQPVVVRLKVPPSISETTQAYNISGDIPGETDDIVIMGGHLDSWDVGTGALDNASGVGISMAAAKIATAHGKPRRTLRVVLWGAEEQGGSGPAYAKAHAATASRIVVGGEADTGADLAYAVALPKGGYDHPAMRAFRLAVTPLGVVVRTTPATSAGADLSDLVRAGVPPVHVAQDLAGYLEVHHSENDTLDRVDPAKLAQNVAVWAAFLHAVAYTDIDFRALAQE